MRQCFSICKILGLPVSFWKGFLLYRSVLAKGRVTNGSTWIGAENSVTSSGKRQSFFSVYRKCWNLVSNKKGSIVALNMLIRISQDQVSWAVKVLSGRATEQAVVTHKLPLNCLNHCSSSLTARKGWGHKWERSLISVSFQSLKNLCGDYNWRIDERICPLVVWLQ